MRFITKASLRASSRITASSYILMEIVKEELQLENSKDAVCIPPIPLPHMHSGFLCLSGGSFMVAALMGVEILSTSKSVPNPDSDVTNLTYVFDLI